MAGYLSVIGIQLKQYLVSALMCQRKPAFSAEFPNIRRFNEALTQNYNVVEAHEKGGAKAAKDIEELVGEKLVKRCGSRDPFEIARQLGINVMLCDNFGSLKGMYRVIKRNRFIFLNNSLDENMLRIVCAHELGHDQLHRNMAKTTPIHEFMLYDMKSKPEYEANIVAAEILMDSNEVLRYIYEYGYTAEQIASAMSTDINLVALKVAHLATLGYNLHALEHKSNFLK